MNCDPIARWYRWLEYAAFGCALQRRRQALLAHVANARTVLVLGDGDGRGLAALLKVNPDANVDVIDSSARMLELARARTDAQRVRYYHADALGHPLPRAAYDLIVTHFFLDCFDDVQMAKLVERVAGSATLQSRWLISEFRKPGLWVGLLYAFFRHTTGLKTRRLVDHHLFLQRHDFRLTRSESSWGRHLVSELWERCPARVY